MSDLSVTSPSRRTSTVRQLKLLVVLLVLSNVALGAFGFYSLRTVDRKYSRLITDTVPALNDLEEVAIASVTAMRNTNPVLYGAPSGSRKELASQARIAMKRHRELRERIAERELALVSEEASKNFRNMGAQFDSEAVQVVALLESGRDAEAQASRENSLRPTFERYLTEVTKTADALQAESLRASETLTSRTSSISHIMLGVAGWPVFVLMAFLAAVLVTILLIRIFLFGSESAI